MKITDVQISLVDNEKLKGFANITLDNHFVVRGLKIICGLNGYFIAMPAQKNKDGTYKDIAHPITSCFREEMEKIVLGKYNEIFKKFQLES